LAKDESLIEQLGSVMRHLVEGLRQIAILIEPFMPRTTPQIFAQLGINYDLAKTWNSLNQYDTIEAGTKVIAKGEPIFPRLEMDVEVAYIKAEMNQSITAEKALEEVVEEIDEIPSIGIEDFMKIELKIGEIKACKQHPKADRLLISQIDIGTETRQIVSGIAEHYKPEELIGKKVVVVTNLKPVKLRGEVSEGMVLAASADGKLNLPEVLGDLPAGSIVK